MSLKCGIDIDSGYIFIEAISNGITCTEHFTAESARLIADELNSAADNLDKFQKVGNDNADF